MNDLDKQETQPEEDNFGKVVEELHNEQKIPRLRTYQGDVANFIKEKNESTISIALKEKAKKKEEGEEVKIRNPKTDGSNFQINITSFFLSVFLLLGGLLLSIYIFNFLKNRPEESPVIQVEIIPYNNLVTLNSATKESLVLDIASINYTNGINIIKISDNEGKIINDSKKFLELIGVPSQRKIIRNLDKNFVFGSTFTNQKIGDFIILTTKDFEVSFSSMLEWEKDMLNDLTLLNKTKEQNNEEDEFEEISFSWKDSIIKNKDVRIYGSNGKIDLAYTFLDKNTILITNSINLIEDISSAYVSGKVVR